MSEPLFTPAFRRLIVVNMAFHFGFSIFHLLPKYMAEDLRARPSEIGALATVFGLANIASVPLVGRLLDSAGKAKVLLLGCALFAVSSLGFTLVDDVGPTLFALRALHGLALSLFVSAGSILSAESAPAGRMAQAIGMFAGSGMVMTAISTSLGEYIAAHSGYAPAFALAGLTGVIAAYLARGLHEPAVELARSGSLREVIFRATSLRMSAVLGLSGLGFGAMFSFSAPFSLELGTTNVRGFFIAFTAAALLVRVGCGRFIDRVGHRRTSMYSLFGYAGAVSLMVGLTPARLELFGFLFGIAHGLFIPAFTAFVVGEAQRHERNKVLTLFHGAFNVGQCLVFALGMGAEQWGYPAVFGATGALVLVAPIILSGWRTHGRELEAPPLSSTAAVGE